MILQEASFQPRVNLPLCSAKILAGSRSIIPAQYPEKGPNEGDLAKRQKRKREKTGPPKGTAHKSAEAVRSKTA